MVDIKKLADGACDSASKYGSVKAVAIIVMVERPDGGNSIETHFDGGNSIERVGMISSSLHGTIGTDVMKI